MTNIILTLIILISVGLTSSCIGNFSISNPDITKLTQKAQQLMKKKDFHGAISRLVVINDLNPNLAENHYNLGIAYYRNDQPEKALESLIKATELNKKLKDAYYSIAVIYEDMALQKAEELGKIKDKEAKLTITDEIAGNYKNAIKAFVAYVEYSNSPEEKQKVLEKIEEFNRETANYETPSGSESKE